MQRPVLRPDGDQPDRHSAQPRLPATGVGELGVAAVDDDVTLVEVGEELVDPCLAEVPDAPLVELEDRQDVDLPVGALG